MSRIALRAAPTGCGRKDDLMMHLILMVGAQSFTKILRGTDARQRGPLSVMTMLSVVSKPQSSSHRPVMKWKVMPGCSSVTSRSEEHTSELQSLMRISYAVFC